jgi:diaminopimelate epimerase
MKLHFTKMHGAGNDFVVLDATQAPINLSSAQLRHLADRHLGVGCDQILMVQPSSTPGVDFRYRIFNGASGEEVEHCGNGARCFARFVVDKGLVRGFEGSEQKVLRVETVNTLLELHLLDGGDVRVDMNRPSFDLADLPFDANGLTPRPVNGFELWPLPISGQTLEVALVSMGNPHAVVRVADLDAMPIASAGPLIEGHVRFAKRVNAGFMQIVDRNHVRLRVYERGAGETLSCGSGACAAVVAGMRLGELDERVQVQTRGGLLTIEWLGALSEQEDAHVFMSGPAQMVFEGEISL